MEVVPLARRRIARWLGTLLLVGAIGLAQAQGARAEALAGTSIPGRDLDTRNPAALAMPTSGARGTEISLPIGLLHYLISDWADPFGPEADYYAILAQLTQLETLLLVVPRAPESWTVTFGRRAPVFDAVGGANPSLPERYGLARSLELPLRFVHLS